MNNQSTQKYIELGYLDLDDDVVFEYNYEAANCFGNSYTTWIQSGAAKHAYDDNILIWFPKFFKNEEWANYQMLDYKVIKERCLDISKIEDHLEKTRNGPQKRIIFASMEDKSISNKSIYRFLGLYELIPDGKIGETTWKRIATRVNTYSST
ncbi:hypothetical protein [Acinetobacter modestus]|uniref:PvuRts1 I-like SET and RING associated domain-containing protein n=1 Tax=Acinetobacter modestus TaxID=1776740 RepID=A0ABN0JSC9_9GAMM|nr:hypothetical protein [Acinetobacter modestus]ENU28190.1 hypothetical protein F992_00298 [Acinetobacter modestus]GGA26767.1 hypothetical protein GCM10017554_24940 [Acinetobacter modestus]